MKLIKNVFLTCLVLISLVTNQVSVYASEQIINDPVQFVTIKKENFEMHGAPIHVVIKHIENVSNVEVERQINTLIDRFINDKLAQVKKDIDEMSKNSEKVIMEVYLDLSDYYVSQDLVSFSLDFTQIMADSYEQKQYHTIDLKTGKELSLKHWLGKDYASIVKNEVVKQINQQNQENGMEIYFMDEVNKLKIEATQPYYINKDGQVVVTFPKFTIAPGYVGLPEFIMPHNIKEVNS